MLALIEVLDPDNNPVERLKTQSWPVSIGRALDNDIVLDDPHVAAYHATIEKDASEAIWVRDHGTLNRIRVSRHSGQLSELRLQDGDEFHLGRTKFHIRLADACMAGEKLVVRNHPFARMEYVIGAMLVLTILTYVDVWLSSIEKNSELKTIGPVFMLLLCLSLWTITWTTIGRLISKRTEFLPHLGIGASIILAMIGTEWLFSLASYVFGWFTLSKLESYGFIFLTGVAVFAHLQQANPLRRRMHALIATSLTFLICAFVFANAYEAQKSFSSQLYSNNLFPPEIRIEKSTALDAFLTETDALPKKLEKFKDSLSNAH